MEYIHSNYLLSSSLAIELYHECASKLPIIDYHNHLDAKNIWEDTSATNLTEAWLDHDHYVWRAMRTVGIDERFITGSTSSKEKFEYWCQTMPKLLGNPLYQWSHLELKRYFDCALLLNEANCEPIWEMTRKSFTKGELSSRSVLQRCNVEVLCTTDSPLSNLEYHAKLAQSGFGTQVLPTFRADELFTFHNPPAFMKTLTELGDKTNISIASFDEFLAAVKQRVKYFHQHGCRLSDLGMPTVDFESCSLEQAQVSFSNLVKNEPLTDLDVVRLKSRLFQEIGVIYHTYGWTMQLHIGVLPNVNHRRKNELGPGTGFSVMNDRRIVETLSSFLSQLDERCQLPQTVLYSLNPAHNPLLSCISGAFQANDAGAGKVQFGAAWWFNDHKDGMEAQLTTLKNLGALGCFIGMLTDSRNVFSMSRHEYFRRVLCNQIAAWVENGEIPHDHDLLQQTIENICYYNARNYFNFPSSQNLGVAV
ncbi:glucuronate isomerase [Vibrio celticus]|uniref:glucuronate isomerase n=1 Tax=Vibrio celticus TaxID=446372 RepID=UPI0040686D43